MKARDAVKLQCCTLWIPFFSGRIVNRNVYESVFTDSDLSSDDEEFLSELEEIPPLRELNPAALQDLEKYSLSYGMGYTDFVRSMDQDQNIQEQADAIKAIESEKLKMAGKKSRRERRVLKDQRLRVINFFLRL